MPAMAMLHPTDPKIDLWERIGDLSGIELFHNQVLVATYIRPDRTATNIILPDQVRDEDKFQGKVGMIVKTGPAAFKADKNWSWPENIQTNDWVYYRVSDGWNITVNTVDCRILDDVDIRGRLTHPDITW